MISTREAGNRALSLNAYTNAAGFYQSALELAPAASRARAQLLFQLGRVRLIGGDLESELLSAASEELVAAGDLEMAAEAEAALAEVQWYRGNSDRSAEHLDRARGLVEDGAPSRAKASVISIVCRYLTLAGKTDQAIRLGRQALVMGEQLGLNELRAHVLNSIGVARTSVGDWAGLDDLELSLVLAIELNLPEAINRAYSNLAGTLLECGELDRALASQEEAAAVASRFGLVGAGRWIRGERPELVFLLGRWDEALAMADDFLAEVEAGSPHYSAAGVYPIRGQVLLARDDVHAALSDVEHALEFARLIKDPQALFTALARCAHIFRECGQNDRASILVDTVLAEVKAGRDLAAGALRIVHVLAWTMTALGRADELIQLLPKSDVPWVRAAESFAAGDLGIAADICREMGAVTDEARTRLWLAEALIDQGRRSAADIELHSALAFYRSVGAARYVREAESLLAASA
jgi:tetratricopeptide (TPR) repeat protein